MKCNRERKFLVVSNGRCGSTWLLTSLAQLPGVFADWEFKWRPNHLLGPVHRAFTGPENTCHDVLFQEGCRAPAIGSKVTMDPWLTSRRPSNPMQVQKFLTMDRNDFIKSVPNDVIVIHIVRNYWDILKSGFGRGYVHQLSSSGASSGTASALGAAVRSITAFAGHADANDIDLSKAKLILASLILNDLYLRGLQDRGPNYVRVEYDNIELRFPELAFLVAPWSNLEVVKNIKDQSFTKKLPTVLDSSFDKVSSIKPMYQEAYNWATDPMRLASGTEEYFSRWYSSLTGETP